MLPPSRPPSQHEPAGAMASPPGGDLRALLPAIITGGLILGFHHVIGDIKMFDDRTHTLVRSASSGPQVHAFLWLLGEAIFHFLPVGVCWSAVKKMGGSGSSV